MKTLARPGFTFAEVLFAVMLLGIGFIMVAAIFPVAIQQSQANLEETTGVAVAKAGAKVLGAAGFTEQNLSVDYTPRFIGGTPFQPVYRFDDYANPLVFAPRFSTLASSFINQSDPRYAWVPLGYKLGPSVGPSWDVKNNPDGVAYYEAYVVAVASRNKAQYDQTDLTITQSANGPLGTFMPKRVYFALTEGNNNPDLITFSNPLTPNNVAPYDEPAAAEGAYVVVASDQLAPGAVANGVSQGTAHGRLYRLGVKRDDLTLGQGGVWELARGDDMTYQPATGYNENVPYRALDGWANPTPVYSIPGGAPPAVGFMIGRGYIDPTNPNLGYDGTAQDLYATRVMVFFK